MTVRPATPVDVPMIRALQTALAEPVEDLFADGLPPGHTFVALDVDDADGLPVAWTTRSGSATSHPVGYVHAYDSGYIAELAVAPAHRGHGHGRALMTRVLAALAASGATHAELEVAADNDRAIGLYESLGFEIVDELPDRYDAADTAEDAEDADAADAADAAHASEDAAAADAAHASEDADAADAAHASEDADAADAADAAHASEDANAADGLRLRREL